MVRTAAAAALAILALAQTAHARSALLDDDQLALDGQLFAQANVPPPPPAYPPQPYPPQAYPPPVYQQPVYQQPYQPAPVYVQPVPMRQPHTVMQPRYGMLIAGAVIFGVSWVLDWTFTYGLGHNPGWESIIPLVGPLLQMNDGVSVNPNDPHANGYDGTDTETAARILLIWDFVAQLAGLTLTVLGAVLKHPVVMYTSNDPSGKDQKVRFGFTPGPAGHGSGFALSW